MNRTLAYLSVFLLGCATAKVVRGVAEVPARAQSEKLVVTTEYKTVNVFAGGPEITNAVASHAEQGWKLIGAMGASSTHAFLIFERNKP